MVYMMARSHS